MSEQQKKLDGPDFAQGVPFGDLGEGSMILGHVAGVSPIGRAPGGISSSSISGLTQASLSHQERRAAPH